jgi:prepilin-type N-terminal cleavage/methylation domain-containing protein
MEISKSCLKISKGFSLIELLVAMLMGLALLSSFSVSFIENRKYLSGELKRVEVTSNLQIALELVGSEIRKAGAYTPDLFPSFEVVDGGAASDKLILRYGIIEGTTLCRGIQGSDQNLTFVTTGTGVVEDQTGGTVMVDDGTGTLIPLTNTACKNDYDKPDSVALKTTGRWASTITDAAGKAFGMIYDRSTKRYHGFKPVSVGVPTSTRISLQASPQGGLWPEIFKPLSSSFYLIEETKFEVNNDGILLMNKNGGDEPLQVVGGITKFDLSMETTVVDSITGIKTTSTKNEFAPSDSWKTIDFVSVTLNGKPQIGDGKIRTAESAFTLRNVQSAKVQ